ncbi:MAG: methyltransferase domain-containing protein [Chloroflexota bacterium]
MRSLPRRGLARRADLVELLDRPTADDAEIRLNLQDLARLNRLPGGTRTSIRAVALLARPGERASVLDVGTGLGDMPMAFASMGWHTVAADTHRQVLELAREATATERLVEIVEADCRNLPYSDGAFDVSHCSLLLHHLDPEDAVTALREMARVARRGVVINDLRRGILPFVATGVAVALLGRCRATRVDGITSVRRAYTLTELDELLADAGLEARWRSWTFMPRVATAAVRRSDR